MMWWGHLNGRIPFRFPPAARKAAAVSAVELRRLDAECSCSSSLQREFSRMSENAKNTKHMSNIVEPCLSRIFHKVHVSLSISRQEIVIVENTYSAFQHFLSTCNCCLVWLPNQLGIQPTGLRFFIHFWESQVPQGHHAAGHWSHPELFTSLRLDHVPSYSIHQLNNHKTYETKTPAHASIQLVDSAIQFKCHYIIMIARLCRVVSSYLLPSARRFGTAAWVGATWPHKMIGNDACESCGRITGWLQ